MATHSPRSERPSAAPGGASLEYGLQRRVLLAELALGRRFKEDVCDAHPDLLRAARNGVGRQTTDPCPICEESNLSHVTYVFGAKLPPGGTCPSTKAELSRLERREEPVTCFEVEVCPACAWHHLIRRYPGRGPRATRRQAP